MPFPKSKQLLRESHAYLQRHWQRALQVRQKLRFSEDAFHLVLAGGVGVLGGLVNLFFYYATESVKTFFLRRPGDPVEVAEMISQPWQRILIPTLGGLCAGLVLYWGLRLAGPQRSSNLLEVIVAGDGRLPFRNAIVKTISSLVTIGSGGSIGREGGITHLTATLASKWGQLSHWHPYRLRLLVGCGAASGISAAYNAPISGAVFAALIVLGNFSMHLFAPLVFASVVATMVSRSFFGIHPWYTVPQLPFEFTSVTQLPWFVLLGAVAGVVGAGFLRLLNQAEAIFKKLQAPIYIRLAVGGLIVGALAVQFPGVWGNGYVITNRIIHGQYTSPAFTSRDIADIESLALRLREPHPSDEIAKYVAGQLSEPARKALAKYPGGADPALRRLLLEDLNRLLFSGALYEPSRFANVQLSEETISWLRQHTEGPELVRLNSSLLRDSFPEALGPGSGRSNTSMALLFLTGLLLAKLLATLATVGSGAVGGVFTPTLFLGAALGATFGMTLNLLHVGRDFPIVAFAVVGMGSMLSATLHSPLLAMIMVYEISMDYSLMPALMLACVVSILVSRKLHPDSIYTEPLRRKGLKFSHEPSASDKATERTVSDIMRAPVAPVRETSTVQEIVERFLTGANNFLPVVDAKNQLVGIIALQDLKEHLGSDEQMLGVIAYDVMRPPPVCVTPNQRLTEVLPVVLNSEQRNIPVVSTLKENRLIGALLRAEVLNLFSEAIAESSKSES